MIFQTFVIALIAIASVSCLDENILRPRRTRTRFDPSAFFGPSWSPEWAKQGLKRSGHEFGYEENGINGPNEWKYKFPECGSTEQSPININTKEVISLKTLTRLAFHGYSDAPTHMTLENNGHAIQVNAEYPGEKPYISGGVLDGFYSFSQIHFHWGKNDNEGSEHTINNNSTVLEAHGVHAIDKLSDKVFYDNYVDDNRPSLAVVAYLFQKQEHDNPALNSIWDYLPNVRHAKDQVQISPFPLSKIMHSCPNGYVSYLGSLTTPPCTEDVVWLVCAAPVGISDEQLERLRNLIQTPAFNFRPSQEVNGRTLVYAH